MSKLKNNNVCLKSFLFPMKNNSHSFMFLQKWSRNSLMCPPRSDRFTEWRALWITRPDKHHPAASEPHPVPVSTHSFPAYFFFFLHQKEKKQQQGSSVTILRLVNFLQGACGTHTFLHMANWVWTLWAELFWDSVRRKRLKKKKERKKINCQWQDRVRKSEKVVRKLFFMPQLWHKKQVQA